MSKYFWRPYTQEKIANEPIEIVKAQMENIYDASGNKYIDMISSWWLCAHGHCHPKIATAIATQAGQLDQVIAADFTHKPLEGLMEHLNNFTSGNFAKFFLSDNGSTSVEVAMKIAVQYWKNQGIDKHIFATFDGDYHGDTIGVMSVGKSSGYFDAYSTMCMETNILPYPHTHINDDNIQQKEAEALAVIEKFFANNAHKIAAFLIEPIVQGASGMRIVRFEFLNKVIALAKNYSILVIFDEVMTGFGRTGKMFAYNHLQHVPDIICLSKCVTGGFFPLGVTACKQHIYDQFFSDDRSKTLIHGHSYTANPIICAAAAANLQIFKDEETLDKISQISQIYADWLISDSCPSGAIHKRFLGNIIAFDVSDDIVAKVASAFKANEDGYIEKSVSKNLSDFAKNMKHKMMEVGIYARPIGNTVYCVPPYCIDPKILRNALDKIGYILK